MKLIYADNGFGYKAELAVGRDYANTLRRGEVAPVMLRYQTGANSGCSKVVTGHSFFDGKKWDVSSLTNGSWVFLDDGVD